MAGEGEKPGRNPSDRAQLRAEKDAAIEVAKEKQERRLATVRGAIKEMLRTPTGVIFWSHLFDLCGYNKSSLTRKLDGEIAPLSTECKEAQRLIYLELRKLAPPDLLMRAEDTAEHGEPTPGEK